MNLRSLTHGVCRGTGKVRDWASSGSGAGRDHPAPHFTTGDGCGCVWEPCPGPHIVIEIPVVDVDGLPAAIKVYADPELVEATGFTIE